MGTLWFRFLILLIIAHGVFTEIDDDTQNQSAQSLSNSENTQKQVISKISNAVKEQYEVDFDKSSIPSVREGEKMLEEMCNRNNKTDTDTFNVAQASIRNAEHCFDDIVSFSEIPSKIEAARPHGNLDEVFRGYCQSSKEMEACVQNFLVDIDPCLGDHQKISKYTIQNISQALLEFACENEGDYIALFISEKGPDCILKQQPGIEQCVRQGVNDSESFEATFTEMSNNLNISSNINIEETLNATIELLQCKIAYQIRNCVVNELKKCSESTPANVIESVFNLVKRSTGCSKYSISDLDPNYRASSHSIRPAYSLFIPILTILTSRKFCS